MIGFKHIFIVFISLLFLFSCSDNKSPSTSSGSDPDPKMTLSAQAPTTVNQGEPYSLDISGEQAEGPVDVVYTLSRTEVSDSTVNRTLTPTEGRFNDSLTVDAKIVGDHNIVYSASDSDGDSSDDKNGMRTITVNQVTKDSTMQVTPNAPQTAPEQNGYNVSFSGQKADSDVEVLYTFSRPDAADSTVNRTLSQNNGVFTDTFDVPAGNAGNHQLEFEFADLDDIITGQETIIVQAEPAMKLSSVTAPSSVDFGNPYTVNFSGEQADSPVDVSYTLSRPGVTDSLVSRTLDINNGNFTDAFTVDKATASGEHNLSFTFTDSDDVLNGQENINVAARPELTLSNTAPDAVSIGETYQINFSGTQADSPVDVRYSLSREGLQDSIVTRTLDITNGNFSDNFAVNARTSGQHSLAYEFSDSDDTRSGTQTVSVSVPDDNISQIDITGPSQLYTGKQLEFVFDGFDEDGIDDAIIIEEFDGGNLGETLYDEVPGKNFDQTLTKTFSQPGVYSTTLKIVDDFGRTIQEQKNFTIEKQPDSPPSITLQASSGRGEQNLSLSGTDPDGWKTASLEYVVNGSENNVAIDITENSLSANTTLSTIGEYDITLRATDNLDNQYVRTINAEVLAELVNRQYTINTPFAGIPAELDVDFNNQSVNGLTNSNGDFIHTLTVPKDSLVSYVANADELGLVGITKNGQSNQDTNITMNLQPVPITISKNSFTDMRPRSEKVEDIAEIAQANDTEGTVPVELSLTYDGNQLVVSNIQGTQYNIQTSNQDPANITEQLQITASHPYLTQQQTIDQRITERADIQFIQNFFSGVEQETQTIDLQSILESDATITQASLTNPSPGIQLQQESGFTWNIIPTQDISTTTTYNFDIQAENAEGKQETQIATLELENLPEPDIFSATVHDNVTDEILPNTYLIFENNVNGEFVPVDTLYSPDGRFENIEMTADWAQFGYQENNKNFSYNQRIKPADQGEYEVVIVPFIKRDSLGNEIGQWTRDEMERRHSDMETTWANSGYGSAPGGSIGSFNGGIPTWNTSNGQPKNVIMALNLETQYYDFDGNLVVEKDSMSTRDEGLIQDWYANETRLVNAVGNPKITQPPELTVVEDYVFKVFDRPDGNAYILPRSEPFDRPAISINSNGNGKFYDMVIWLRSNSGRDSGVEGQYAAYTQESVAAFGERGKAPAEKLGPLESMVSNNTNVGDAQWFPLNRFASWITNHTGYQNLPNENKFSNAVILPPNE